MKAAWLIILLALLSSPAAAQNRTISQMTPVGTVQATDTFQDCAGNLCSSAIASNSASAAQLSTYMNAHLPAIGSAASIGTTAGDATSALQACLNAATGSACAVSPQVSLEVLGNITIPAFTTLNCQASFPNNEDNTPTEWGNLPAIMLDGSHTITAGGQGARIANCLIYRNGMAFPTTNPATFPTGSTAFYGGGYRDVGVTNSVIVGFDTCIDTYGSSRARVEYDKVDCSGVTNAAIYGGNDSDIGDYLHLEISPLTSTSQATGCTALVRPGKGFFLEHAQGDFVDDVLVFLYATVGIELQSATSGNPQILQVGKIWSDFDSACSPGSSIGLLVDYGDFNGFVSIADAVVPGAFAQNVVIQNSSVPTTTTTFGRLFIGAAQTDGLTIGGGTGIMAGQVKIGHLIVNGGPAMPINYIDTTVQSPDTVSNSPVDIEHASFYSAHGGVAPFVSFATTPTPVPWNPITIHEIDTNTPTLTVFPNTGTVIPQCAPLASAASLVVPNSGDCFVLTGTTNITAMIGGVWPGREFTLYPPVSSGMEIIQGGNIYLASGATYTANASGSQAIRFGCVANSSSSTGCREEWRSQ